MHRVLLIQWGRVRGSLEYEAPDHMTPEFNRRLQLAIEALASVCCDRGYYDIQTTDVLTGQEVDFEIGIA